MIAAHNVLRLASVVRKNWNWHRGWCRRNTVRKLALQGWATRELRNSAKVDFAIALRNIGGLCYGQVSPSAFFACVQMRTQLVRNRLARTEDAGSHGTNRTLHNPGDFLVPQSLDLAQSNGGSQFLRQVL